MKPISWSATLAQNAMPFKLVVETNSKVIKAKSFVIKILTLVNATSKSHIFGKNLIEVFVCFLPFFFRFVSHLVLKILVAAMENVDGEAGAAGPSTSAEGVVDPSDFYNTGRVGRRNALPDILSSHATVSTADLPDQLSALTTSDKADGSAAGGSEPVASTSSSTNVEPTPSTSSS